MSPSCPLLWLSDFPQGRGVLQVTRSAKVSVSCPHSLAATGGHHLQLGKVGLHSRRGPLALPHHQLYAAAVIPQHPSCSQHPHPLQRLGKELSVSKERKNKKAFMWESAEEITASCAQRPLSLRPGPAIPELWGGWLSGPGRDGSHFARRWCGVRAALSTGGSVHSRPAGTWHGIYSEQLLELLLKQEDMHLEPGSSVWQALFFMAPRRPRRSGYSGGVGVGVGLFFHNTLI